MKPFVLLLTLTSIFASCFVLAQKPPQRKLPTKASVPADPAWLNEPYDTLISRRRDQSHVLEVVGGCVVRAAIFNSLDIACGVRSRMENERMTKREAIQLFDSELEKSGVRKFLVIRVETEHTDKPCTISWENVLSARNAFLQSGSDREKFVRPTMMSGRQDAYVFFFPKDLSKFSDLEGLEFEISVNAKLRVPFKMDQLLDRSINGPTQAQPLKEEEWVKLVLLSEKVRQGDKVYYLEKDGRLYHEPNCVILPLGAIPLLPGDIPGDFKPCMFCNPRLIHR